MKDEPEVWPGHARILPDCTLGGKTRCGRTHCPAHIKFGL